MIIHYKDKKIEILLNSEKGMIQKFGKEPANKIIQRLFEIGAAENIKELPPSARVHPHKPKSKQIFSVDILKHRNPMRLLFKPFGQYDIEDYKTIKEIEVQEVIKIHS